MSAGWDIRATIGTEGNVAIPTIYHPKKKYLYLHIPKTGGTSVSKMVIKDGGDVHMFGHEPLEKVLRYPHVQPEFIFTVIRCPFQRAYSMFRYFDAKGHKLFTFLNFTEFLFEYLPESKDQYRWLMNPQAFFLGGNTEVHLVPFEELGYDLPEIRERLEITAPLTHANKRKNPECKWTKSLRDQVRKLFHEDFLLKDSYYLDT